jgi:hypothetical protein
MGAKPDAKCELDNLYCIQNASKTQISRLITWFLDNYATPGPKIGVEGGTVPLGQIIDGKSLARELAPGAVTP